MHPQVLDFSRRVYELTEFLVDVLGVKLTDLGPPVRLIWHSSCHALREMGIQEQPKSLLRQLANVELVDLKRERECRGFGGTFAVRHPEVSATMVRDKAARRPRTSSCRRSTRTPTSSGGRYAPKAGPPNRSDQWRGRGSE